MTLQRRLWALLAAAVALTALAGVLALALTGQRTAQAQLAQHNRDAAAVLATAPALARADADALRALAAAVLDDGDAFELRLQRPGGAAPVVAARAPRASAAPRWFVAALPLAAPPGQARVAAGGRDAALLSVAADPAPAHDALWREVGRAALLLGGVAVFAAAVAALLLRSWLAPLRGIVLQARSLHEGGSVSAAEPRLPELRALARAMDATGRRLREDAEARARQVELLQRAAQRDALTGLPLRRVFVGRLTELLGGGPGGDAAAGPPDAGGPGAALVLVRLQHLDALNLKLGHAAVDGLLKTVAGVLQGYVDRVAGTFAGRLNGSDFALALPLAGLADETAASLHAALVAAPVLTDPGAEVAVGAVDGLRGVDAGVALAEADAALARSEADGGPRAATLDPAAPLLAGSRRWREQIGRALDDGQCELARYPVVDARGQRLRWDCPLRVRMAPDQALQPAGRWLALARRSRLLPQVDLAALGLALQAISVDGQPRAVHVSWPSLAAGGYGAQVLRCLRRWPTAARRLSVEWQDSGKPAGWAVLAEATRPWRALGVRVGVHHAGEAPQALLPLREAAVDYVKIDAIHVRGAAADDAVARYAAGLVSLVHGLGLEAVAQGVDDAADLQALWALGFDAATGPAVTAAAADTTTAPSSDPPPGDAAGAVPPDTAAGAVPPDTAAGAPRWPPAAAA